MRGDAGARALAVCRWAAPPLTTLCSHMDLRRTITRSESDRIGDGGEEDQKAIYDFGIQLGLAFQLQDDYLDTFGDPETFGKKIGGDILVDSYRVLGSHSMLSGILKKIQLI